MYPVLCLEKGLCGDSQESSDFGHFSVREKERREAGWSRGSHSESQAPIVRLSLFPCLWKGRRLPRC